MTWAVVIARTLVGLVFVVFGLNGVLPQPFIEPPPDLPELVTAWMTPMMSSGYLYVIKWLEVIGGLLLLTGRLAPLAMVILMPIIINIVLFELLMSKQPGIGLVLLGLGLFIIAGYWPYFAPLLTTTARVAGRRASQPLSRPAAEAAA